MYFAHIAPIDWHLSSSFQRDIFLLRIMLKVNVEILLKTPNYLYYCTCLFGYELQR